MFKFVFVASSHGLATLSNSMLYFTPIANTFYFKAGPFWQNIMSQKLYPLAQTFTAHIMAPPDVERSLLFVYSLS